MKVHVFGEITADLCRDVVMRLHESMLKDEWVEVYLNSDGGELEHAFAIYDTLRSLPHKVHVHAIGSCCSAAPLIMLAGDYRTTAPHTQWMLHSASLTEADGTLAEINQTVALAERLMGMYAGILGRHTAKPKAYWARIFRGKADRWFTSGEALAWGIVEEIDLPNAANQGKIQS